MELEAILDAPNFDRVSSVLSLLKAETFHPRPKLMVKKVTLGTSETCLNLAKRSECSTAGYTHAVL
jgi:hypothetical protein